MPKNTDVVKADENTALARPDFIHTGDRTGTEHITRDDVQMPRLALAQSLSPELDEKHARYIEDLKLGHLFNSLTGENFKGGPVEFHIVKAGSPRWVEFTPRDQGGGVKDPNVPPGDKRTEFTKDPTTGMSIPPIATKFYDFVVLLLPWDAVDPMSRFIALSFKSTGLKVAKQLNALIQFRNAPIYEGKYVVTSVDEQNAKGKFKNFQIKNAGWAASAEQVAALKAMYDNLKDTSVVIDRSDADLPDDPGIPPDGEGDTTFDPNAM